MMLKTKRCVWRVYRSKCNALMLRREEWLHSGTRDDHAREAVSLGLVSGWNWILGTANDSDGLFWAGSGRPPGDPVPIEAAMKVGAVVISEGLSSPVSRDKIVAEHRMTY